MNSVYSIYPPLTTEELDKVSSGLSSIQSNMQRYQELIHTKRKETMEETMQNLGMMNTQDEKLQNAEEVTFRDNRYQNYNICM